MNDSQDSITTGTSVPDMVNHPSHYTEGPSLGKLECLDVTRWMPFTLGNAFKYTWRAGKKNPAYFVEDLRKARFYLVEWKGLLPWRVALYNGNPVSIAMFLKSDFRQWEPWRYRALRAIAEGSVEKALEEIDQQIKAAELAADAAFRRYEPEDETDDPD